MDAPAQVLTTSDPVHTLGRLFEQSDAKALKMREEYRFLFPEIFRSHHKRKAPVREKVRLTPVMGRRKAVPERL